MRQLSIMPEQLLPRLGSEEVRDRVGMSEALVTLATSLRHGRNSKHIQYDTMRKTQTWPINTHDAGQEYSCKTVVGLDRAKQYVTTGHTSGKWFGRFMRGSRMRMGMIHRQNKASTSALAMAICAGLKADGTCRSGTMQGRNWKTWLFSCWLLWGQVYEERRCR